MAPLFVVNPKKGSDIETTWSINVLHPSQMVIHTHMRMDQTQMIELWNPLSSVAQTENSIYDVSNDVKYYN